MALNRCFYWASSLVVFGFCLMSSPPTFPLDHPDTILVIAPLAAPVSELTKSETANLFLGIGRHDLNPFDRDDLKLRTEFYNRVASLSLTSVRAHWAKQVFTGRGRPPKRIGRKLSDQMNEKNPNAVTYVSANNQPPGCKVLLVLNMEDEQ